MHWWVVLKNNIKICIKIYIKGAVSMYILMQILILFFLRQLTSASVGE